MSRPSAATAVVEEEDHQEAEEDLAEGHQAAQEDHQEEEAAGHWEVVQVPVRDTSQEGPNLWETPLKYLMESAKGHNCSSRNGRPTGVSIIKSTRWHNPIVGYCVSYPTSKDLKCRTGSHMSYVGSVNRSTADMSSQTIPGYGPK